MMTAYTIVLLLLSIAFGFAQHNVRSFMVVACIAGFVVGLSAFRARHGQAFVSRKPLQPGELAVLVILPIIGALCFVGSAIYAAHNHDNIPPALVAVGVAAALGDGWFGLHLWMRR